MDWVVLVLVVGGLWFAALSALVDIARTPSRAFDAVGRTKLGVLMGLFFTCGVGGIYYWLRVRPDVRAGP